MIIPTAPHNDYCPNCPSRMGQLYGHDPEAEMFMELPDGEKQKAVFPCAWRPEKLCKGICENQNYDETRHKYLIEERQVYGNRI